MTLPACLTRFNPVALVDVAKPKLFYDVILSRPPHGVMTMLGLLFWSRIGPVRCLLSRQSLHDYLGQGYRACILREFDEVPQ